MFWFVTACLFGLIGAIMVLVGKVESGQGRNAVSFNLRPFGLIPLVIAFLLLITSVTYTQDPGEAIVIKSFSGKVQDKPDTTQGLGFTAPWNSAIKFDIRNQKIEMFGNAGGEGKDGAVIQSPLQGSSNAYVSITVGYDILPASVLSIYNQFRTQDNLKDQALKPGIRDEVRKATSAFPPFQVKERRAQLTEDIRTRLSERWAPLGVTVVSVDLGDLSLDPETENALKLLNTRQAEVEGARSALDKSRINAEEIKTKARAEADADQITRCGAITTTEVRDVAGKPEEVTIITPKSGAACENLLNEQVLLSNLIEVYGRLADGNQLVVTNGDTLLQLPVVGGK